MANHHPSHPNHPPKKKPKSTTRLWVRLVALGCALLMLGTLIPFGIFLLS